MGYAQDLVNSGFGGYQGWGDAEAQADFNATHGAGKQTTSGGGGGGGNGSSGGGTTFNPVSAPDIVKLENQTFEQLKPYYLQLLKESQGDLTRAVQGLVDDYNQGTRAAKQQYATSTGSTLGDLKNTMSSLGLTFTKEQEAEIDDLNKRGIATYQQSPDQAPNNVKMTLPHAPDLNPASANLSTLVTNGEDTSGIAPLQTLPNDANLGRGGVELGRLMQDQQLRQEAQQRAANNKLQTAGIDLTKFTNANGLDLSTPEGVKAAVNNPNLNRGNLGSAELNVLQGTDTETRNQQKTAEDLFDQMQNRVLSTATGLAGAGVKESGEVTSNLFNQGERQQFVNQGSL